MDLELGLPTSPPALLCRDGSGSSEKGTSCGVKATRRRGVRRTRMVDVGK